MSAVSLADNPKMQAFLIGFLQLLNRCEVRLEAQLSPDLPKETLYKFFGVVRVLEDHLGTLERYNLVDRTFSARVARVQSQTQSVLEAAKIKLPTDSDILRFKPQPLSHPAVPAAGSLPPTTSSADLSCPKPAQQQQASLSEPQATSQHTALETLLSDKDRAGEDVSTSGHASRSALSEAHLDIAREETTEDLLSLTAALKQNVLRIGHSLKEDKAALDAVQEGVEQNLNDLQGADRQFLRLSQERPSMVSSCAGYTLAYALFFLALAIILTFRKPVS